MAVSVLWFLGCGWKNVAITSKAIDLQGFKIINVKMGRNINSDLNI